MTLAPRDLIDYPGEWAVYEFLNARAREEYADQARRVEAAEAVCEHCGGVFPTRRETTEHAKTCDDAP